MRAAKCLRAARKGTTAPMRPSSCGWQPFDSASCGGGVSILQLGTGERFHTPRCHQLQRTPLPPHPPARPAPHPPCAAPAPLPAPHPAPHSPLQGLALGMDAGHEAAEDDVATMVDTNCVALARMTRLVVPAMAARDSGHVVNMSSVGEREEGSEGATTADAGAARPHPPPPPAPLPQPPTTPTPVAPSTARASTGWTRSPRRCGRTSWRPTSR